MRYYHLYTLHPTKQISCGARHSAVVDKLGRLYTSGCNLNGQLGRSLSSEDVASGSSSRRQRHRIRRGDPLSPWTFGVSAGILDAEQGHREGTQGTTGKDEALKTRSVESVVRGDEKKRRRRDRGQRTLAKQGGRHTFCCGSADFPGRASAGITGRFTKRYRRVSEAEDDSVRSRMNRTGKGGDGFGAVKWGNPGAREEGIHVACGGYHTLVLASTRYDDLSCSLHFAGPVLNGNSAHVP